MCRLGLVKGRRRRGGTAGLMRDRAAASEQCRQKGSRKSVPESEYGLERVEVGGGDERKDVWTARAEADIMEGAGATLRTGAYALELRQQEF